MNLLRMGKQLNFPVEQSEAVDTAEVSRRSTMGIARTCKTCMLTFVWRWRLADAHSADARLC